MPKQDLSGSLIENLGKDAAKLAEGLPVSPEIERRTIGQIGLLVCSMAGSLWSVEQLNEVVDRRARMAVEVHVKDCALSGAGSEGFLVGPPAKRRKREALFDIAERHFVHIWWGFVLLCLVFGVESVLKAIKAFAAY